MPEPPPVGWVVVWSDDPPATIVARLGADRPDVSSGYGGWEEVARPRRSTVTTWQGQPARRMTLAILLDKFVADASIEDDIRRLERMALPRTGGEPPTVRVEAKGSHVPYNDLTWVIDTLAWGDAIMNASGNRVRQAATLTLLEYVSDDVIAARTRRSPAQRRRAKARAASGANRKKNAREKRKPAGRNRRSRSTGLRAAPVEFAGDDLMSIAARELGDARRWHEIAELNGIRDPRAIAIGQVLRLP
jgi:hypothetical protein